MRGKVPGPQTDSSKGVGLLRAVVVNIVDRTWSIRQDQSRITSKSVRGLRNSPEGAFDDGGSQTRCVRLGFGKSLRNAHVTVGESFCNSNLADPWARPNHHAIAKHSQKNCAALYFFRQSRSRQGGGHRLGAGHCDTAALACRRGAQVVIDRQAQLSHWGQ